MPRPGKEGDVIVIGGGLVGTAVALSLIKLGLRVVVLDGSDSDFSASRANFGLVWAQGKGGALPAYQALTQESIALWPAFAEELRQLSGIDVYLETGGGLGFFLSEEELETKAAELARLDAACDVDCQTQIIGRAELERLLPGIRLGNDVTGASYCPLDGAVDPLRLLRAMHLALAELGGELIADRTVHNITAGPGLFHVSTAEGSYHATTVVISAGLGTPALAAQVGIDLDLRPSRGQLLVTERIAPILPMPCSGLRQTREGTMLIGSTREDVGYDPSTTLDAMVKLSRRALQVMPDLAGVGLVRQWAGLRIMSPDACPVYAESTECPGVFITACHSGVTLAPLHAGPLGEAVARRSVNRDYAPFHHRRFSCSEN